MTEKEMQGYLDLFEDENIELECCERARCAYNGAVFKVKKDSG